MIDARQVGNSRVSVLGLGCSRVGSLANPTPIAEIRATIDAAFDAGVTLFDTSNVYGQGDSEAILGERLGPRRSKVFLVTKAGKRFSRKARMLRAAKPSLRAAIAMYPPLRKRFLERRSQEISLRFSAGDVEASLNASLGRLRTDYVDALLLHSPPLAVLESPELPDALARLRKAGKLRHYGVSVDTLEELQAALRFPGTEMIQAPIGTIAAAADAGLTSEWKRRGIGLVARELIKTTLPAHLEKSSRSSVFDYALGLDGVVSAIVGASTRAHLQDLIASLP